MTARPVAALALAVLVVGCASLTPPPYWYKDTAATKEITVVVTDYLPVWCPKYPFARACASRDHEQCWVYVRPEWMDNRNIIAHEKCHCAGYSHEIDESRVSEWGRPLSYSNWNDGAACPIDTDVMPHALVDDRKFP